MSGNKHIVRFTGGLGNQLFEYALYRVFEEKGYNTYADISWYKRGHDDRNLQLPYLGIKLNEAKEEDVKKLYCAADNKIKQAIIKRIGKKTYYRQRELYFDEKILKAPRGYFDGYWQSYRYFIGYEKAVRDNIRFQNIENLKLSNEIKNCEASVSVHVRLGDYLNNPKLYGGICTAEYYEKAIEIVRNKLLETGVKKPLFFIFSNDIVSAKEILKKDEYIYVDGHSELEGYKDMYLMSLCTHHIIANSSFSWWGAYLSESSETMVVAPSRWMNNYRAEDILLDTWIKL